MSEKITFKELVEQIARASDQSQNSTNSFIHELVQIIESGLRANGSVSISGFGKFELRWMQERRGRNPQTGQEITIPGQNKVVFKPYKALRDEVNRPYAKMKAQILGKAPSSSENIPPQKTEHQPAAEEPSADPFEELLVEHNRPKSQTADEKETSKADENTPTKPEKTERPDPLYVHEVNEARLAQEVEKSGQMKWAYAASTIIVALALLAVLYLAQRSDEPAQMALEAPDNEQIESVQESAQSTAMELVKLQEEDPGVSAEPEPDIYSVQPGESLWSIAEKELGDPYLWPWIYQLNIDLLDNPNRILKDTELTIPSLSNPDNLDSDQRDQVAMGYLSLYNWSQDHQPDEAKFFLWAVGEFSTDILEQASQRVDSGDLAFAKTR